MAKFDLKIKTHVLRRQGVSMNVIAKKLGVSKSSVSLWCRDLDFTKAERQLILRNALEAGNRGRMAGAETNRKKRLNKIARFKLEAIQDVGKVSERDIFMMGIALYWAEGSRKSRMGFSNSEPELIRFMQGWFKKFLFIKQNELRQRIFINAIHRHRIDAVIKFWSSYLKIPQHQFGKPVLLKKRPRKIYKNHDSYYGVLALGAKNSNNIKYKILGLIDAIKKQKLPV